MITNQKYLTLILISCTPDWHSENMNMSYVFTIWILGFSIPTLFIVVTSVVTCAKMQQVIQKASTKLIFSIDIYMIYNEMIYHAWYQILIFDSSGISSNRMLCVVCHSKEIKELFVWYLLWTFVIYYHGFLMAC